MRSLAQVSGRHAASRSGASAFRCRDKRSQTRRLGVLGAQPVNHLRNFAAQDANVCKHSVVQAFKLIDRLAPLSTLERRKNQPMQKSRLFLLRWIGQDTALHLCSQVIGHVALHCRKYCWRGIGARRIQVGGTARSATEVRQAEDPVWIARKSFPSRRLCAVLFI